MKNNTVWWNPTKTIIRTNNEKNVHVLMVNNIGTKTDPRATQKQEDKRKTKHFRIG